MKSKTKRVKAWGIVFKGNLDSDDMNWGGVSYCAFADKTDAMDWLGDDVLYDKIIPITITYQYEK